MSAAITYTHRTVVGHRPARIICTDAVDPKGTTTCALVLNVSGDDETQHWLRSDLTSMSGEKVLEPMPERVDNWMASDEEGMFTSNCRRLADIKNEHPDAAAYVNIVTENGVPVSMEVVKP